MTMVAEKLIEDIKGMIVEKTIVPASIAATDKQEDAVYDQLVLDILAVFEKALGEATVTPTDDERETLMYTMWSDDRAHGRAHDPFDQMNERSLAWYRDNAMAILAAGFRRSAVPEPSAECPKCGVRVTDETPSTFYTHHDEACGGPLEEPQGEPSDADIEFPFTYKGVTLEQDDGGVWVSDAGGSSYWISPLTLAALRAANEVGNR